MDARVTAHARTWPRPATGFIGREADVTEMCARFQQGARLVTLTGPGGVGKTRVALAVAERLDDAYPAGAVFVSLAPIADHRLVIPTIARTIGIMEQSGQPILDRLIDHLRDRRMLLVLDNVEHVVEAANSVAELLRACQHVSMLATSREPLHITGEQEYAVPPLPLPDPDSQPSASALSDNDAVRLFVDRATGVSSTFVLTEANAPAVNAICHRVGGLPLAIELAAARIKVLPPEELLARIELSANQGSLTLLTGGPRDAPERQQTMRDTIQWSHDLLTDDERRAFRQLAVFASGWTLEAVEAIVEQADVFEMLASLIDKSLVQHVDRPGQPDRYWMLEPIRQFGLELLSQHGDERSDVRRRHAMYVLSIVDGLVNRLDSPGAAIWYERIESEHDNIRAALRWAKENGEVDLGLQLVAHVGKFWDQRGYLIEGWAHFESFLSMPGAERRTTTRAAALCTACRLLERLGRMERNLSLANEACAISAEHGDWDCLAHALLVRGIGYLQQGDDELAQADWEQAMRLLQASADRPHAARVLLHLSDLARRRGDHDRWRALVKEAHDLARSASVLTVTSLSLRYLGQIAEESGNDELAAERYRERLRINRELGMPWSTSHTLEYLARLARRQGQFERAACMLACAAVLHERSGSPFIATDDFEIVEEVQAVRDALSDDVFQAAWSRCQAMTMDEASEYALQDDVDRSAASESAPTTLTRRELDVLRLLVDGKSNQEIASDLFISPNTVTTHVANIMNKLGLDSRTAVATWAVRNSIV